MLCVTLRSRPQPAAGAGPGAAPEAVQGGGLSEEELQRKTDSLLEEYASTLDKKEALQCVQELQSPVRTHSNAARGRGCDGDAFPPRLMRSWCCCWWRWCVPYSEGLPFCMCC